MLAPRLRRPLAALLVAVLAAPATAAAADWTVDVERSTFAVLVQREGIASAFAHDHLVVARGPECELAFDPDSPRDTRFQLRQSVLALEVDADDERRRLAPRLQTLGAISRDLPPLSAESRAEIRREMLAPGQLHAERFPELRAELVALAPRGGEGAASARVALGWDATIRVELRGATVETTAPARFEIDGDALTAELLAELRFTDFGIEPYRAALGTVRNADLFHVYVELLASRELP